MAILPLSLTAKSTQSATRSPQNRDSCPKTHQSTRPRTSEDSVSNSHYFPFSLTFIFDFVVDKPFLRPRRDYDEYTKFINDTFTSEKECLVTGTVDHLNRTGGFENFKTKPLDTLKTFTEKDLSLLNRHHRNNSASGNDIEQRLGSSIADFNVKPKLLESKISTRQDFAMLSDGFKKIFTQDKKD